MRRMDPPERPAGAANVLAGGALFLLGVLAAGGIVVHGEALLAAVGPVIALVGGLYAQYHRERATYRGRGR